MTMWPIGNNKSFTFIEIMETVVVLSIGIVAIFHTFFINVDALTSSLIHLDGQHLINNKFWEIEESLQGTQSLVIKEFPNIVMHNKELDWEISFSPIGPKGLYKVNITLSSPPGPRAIRISRASYVLKYPVESE